MSGRERGAMVSRRDLLRDMVSRVVRAVGAESAVLPLHSTPVLRVPYVPYTSRPGEPRESQVEEEQR